MSHNGMASIKFLGKLVELRKFFMLILHKDSNYLIHSIVNLEHWEEISIAERDNLWRTASCCSCLSHVVILVAVILFEARSTEFCYFYETKLMFL